MVNAGTVPSEYVLRCMFFLGGGVRGGGGGAANYSSYHTFQDKWSSSGYVVLLNPIRKRRIDVLTIFLARS